MLLLSSIILSDGDRIITFFDCVYALVKSVWVNNIYFKHIIKNSDRLNMYQKVVARRLSHTQNFYSVAQWLAEGNFCELEVVDGLMSEPKE